MKSLALTLLGAATLVLTALPSSAQTFTNGGTDSSWTNAANWNNGAGPSPFTVGSGAVVDISTLPSNGGIQLDYAAASTISSLTFDSSLTGTVLIRSAGVQTLQVNGSISNNSSALDILDATGLTEGATSTTTFAGGTGGLLLLNLSIGTSTIAATGSVTIGNPDLNMEIDSATSFGSISNVTVGTTTTVGGFAATPTRLDINTDHYTTAAAGDFFQLITGTLNLNSTNPVAFSQATPGAGLAWVTTLIQKGIVFVASTAGGTVINAGITLPIDTSNQFNPNQAGTAADKIVFNGTATSAAKLVTDTTFTNTRAITINSQSLSVIAATDGTTATYSGVIADAGATPVGTLKIGDATNQGTVLLTGANTYTGGTTVAAGTTFEVGNTTGSATGTGTVSLGIGDTLVATTSGSKVTGQLNLSGSNTLVTNSGATLTLGSISVAGSSNAIFSGSTVVSSATLTNSSSALAVNGTLTGTVNVGTGTLTGIGSISGAVTVAGAGKVSLGNGSIGALTVGGLSTGSSTAPTSLTFDIQTVGSTTTVDKLIDNGTLTLAGGKGGTTIVINSLSGTTTLTNAVNSYVLLTYTGTQQTLANLALSTTVLDGKNLALSQSGDTVYLDVLAASNTFIGVNAGNLALTGVSDTGVGNMAFFSATSGSQNTALGYYSLEASTIGAFNTGSGCASLQDNTVGDSNTAYGFGALFGNTNGYTNVAIGYYAMAYSGSGTFDTADGCAVMQNNSVGSNDTGSGYAALFNNSTGSNDTANGFQALDSNTTGGNNTAIGNNAFGSVSTGSANVALGFNAGQNVTTGSNNIVIGDSVNGTNSDGTAANQGVMRIGTSAQTSTFIAGISGKTITGASVQVSSSGQVGVLTSSRRFKDHIESLGATSDALLALQPVSYRYKPGVDPTTTPQFGLVAEEVANVDPDLVIRDENGKPYTVRYQAVNAMLLNEILKEHEQVEQQQTQLDTHRQKLDLIKAKIHQIEAARAVY